MIVGGGRMVAAGRYLKKHTEALVKAVGIECREHSELSGVGNMPIVRFS